MFYRLYTGDDGESHLEELDLEKGPIEWEAVQKATGVGFRRQPPGYFSDWHHAPRRQYVITLAGGVEIGLGDGTVKRLGPGDVMLADDLTGRGHTTRVTGNDQRISVVIPLD
jgi:uncharacterized cupin superfamily protein